jgi:hypothetical protein
MDDAKAILKDLRDKAQFFHSCIELEPHGPDELDGKKLLERIEAVIGKRQPEPPYMSVHLPLRD